MKIALVRDYRVIDPAIFSKLDVIYTGGARRSYTCDKIPESVRRFIDSAKYTRPVPRSVSWSRETQTDYYMFNSPEDFGKYCSQKG